MNIEKIESCINSYHLLYSDDIRAVITKIIKKDKINNMEQLEKTVKFLESMYSLIDFEILDDNIFEHINKDIAFTPKPNMLRVMIMNNLLDSNLINFDYLFNEISFDTIEIFTNETYYNLINSKDGIKKLKSRYSFNYDLIHYYHNILSCYCYLKLHDLVFDHIFDFKKNSVKLAYKLYNLRKSKKKNIIVLFYKIIESDKQERTLLYSNNIEKYDFNDKEFGSAWESIYNKIKEVLL